MVVSNKNSSLLNYFTPFYYFLCAEDSLCLLCLYGWNTISLYVTGHLFPRLSSGHHNGSLKSVLGVLIPLLQIKVTPITPSKAVLKYLLAHPCATWWENPAIPSPVPEESHRALHLGRSTNSEWSISAGLTALFCNPTMFLWSGFPSMPQTLSFSDLVHFPPTSNPLPPPSLCSEDNLHSYFTEKTEASQEWSLTFLAPNLKWTVCTLPFPVTTK